MRVLLIDTCGETGSVALAEDDRILASQQLAARAASATLLSAVRDVLSTVSSDLHALGAVGVVSGPGSFTGVRVGLAAAKGLCEAANLPLAAVSRLEVLAEAAGQVGRFVVLDAGRGEAYVRRPDGVESLVRLDEFGAMMPPKAPVVVTESRMLTLLADFHPQLREIQSEHVLSVVLRTLQAGVGDAALVDANYVRSEQDIYPRNAVRA